MNKLPCFGDRKWSFATTLNGALSGMVSFNFYRMRRQWQEMVNDNESNQHFQPPGKVAWFGEYKGA
jgi:hypothetical protein